MSGSVKTGSVGLVSVFVGSAMLAAPPAHGFEFTMQVQTRPLSAPQDPAHRVVHVDCEALATRGAQKLLTGRFIKAFDPTTGAQYNAAGRDLDRPEEANPLIAHIGSRVDVWHELGVAQAELMTNKAVLRQTGYAVNVAGKTYRTTVPVQDNRYAPHMAAFFLCTGQQGKLSTVYNVTGLGEKKPEGDVTLNPQTLQTLSSPPIFE